MKNPSKIRILGIDYSVNYADLRKQGGCEDVGNVNNQNCSISISSNINSEQHAKSVLLHEIIEALDYRLEIGLKHRQITQIEAGLIQVIRDNPHLLQHLNGE